ncbi:MAG: hypothetical protein GKS06_00855 [Acidobacteria bacterium]|nr:hypothetical protein [Acidobacteriota bacterium]
MPSRPRVQPSFVLLLPLLLGAAASAHAVTQSVQASERVVQVPLAELVEAMLPEVGYDAATTTNSGRFQAAVYVRLARAARDRGTQILSISSEDWFQAFLEYSGLEEEELPQYLLLMREHGQNVTLDIRADAVIERVKIGREPEVAMNVRLEFEARPDRAKNFSYEDHLSEPPVLVHNESTISYRLMDMGDQIFMDEISGSKVRPLTGSLGALFAVIGLADIRRVRTASSEDGSSVTVAEASKSIVTVPAAVTTSPWGRAERGVSPNRDDLLAIEERLRKPLEFDYYDMDWETVSGAVNRLVDGPLPPNVDFLGNASLKISDGFDTLYSDFPYVSGAYGYMEYDAAHVAAASKGVALITHAHDDHWSRELFERTGLTLVAPPEIAEGLDAARVAPWGESIRLGGLVIHPVETAHAPEAAHCSYTVEWGGRRLHFTGDTEDPSALLAATELDAAFVTPWLLREVLAAGQEIDAELVVVYHHTANEDVPRGDGIHVPSPNSTFRIR